MKIIYKNKKTERLCTDFSYAKKELNFRIAEKLHVLIRILQSAETLEDIARLSTYRLHSLQGNLNGKLSLDIAGRKAGYRLLIVPLDADGIERNNDDIRLVCQFTEIILIWEVSNHYE